MTLKPPYVATRTYNATADFEASQWNVPFQKITVTDSLTTPDPTRVIWRFSRSIATAMARSTAERSSSATRWPRMAGSHWRRSMRTVTP